MRRYPYIMRSIIGIGLLVGLPSFSMGADLDMTLRMILDAPKTVSYEGTLIRRRISSEGRVIQSMQRVVHRHPDHDRVEFLEPSRTRGDVQIRIKDDVYTRETKKGVTVYAHRRLRYENELDLGLGFSSLDLLQTNYELAIEGRDTILGRPSVILAIKPRHPGRLSKIAWIDWKTGLVLRAEDRDEAGHLIEEFFFSRLEINPTIDASYFDTNEWKGRSVEKYQVIACGSMQEVQRKAGFALAAPVYIPAGFTLQQRRVIPYAGQPIVHFTYTDGLTQISLFERIGSLTDSTAREWPRGEPELRDGVQIWKRGPSTILRYSDDDKLYTVISDIDETELIEMVKSLCTIKAAAAPEPNQTRLYAVGGVTLVCLAFGARMWWRRRSML